MKGVYIAGPMRGYPNYNFDAFDEAKSEATKLGYHPVSPADMDRLYEGWGKYAPEGWAPSEEDKLRMINRDLAAISGCSSIYMLRGWKKSARAGAVVELAYAQFLGKEVIFQ